MSTEQVVNNAQTALSASLSSKTPGQTDTLTVTSSSGFPTTPQFRILVDNEIMLVTAVSGTTWTVTRGSEQTSAPAHASNATVTQVLTAGVETDIISCLKGYVYGLGLTYVSGTSISVAPGVARDNTNGATLSLSSAQTISTGTLSAINGNDQFAIAGTVVTSSTSKTVTGTGTSFLTAFGTRAGTGTITGGSTTITGTGTKFLSEVAVGDLIGNTSKGYSRVTAIASDTSLTISVAIPGGSPGGAAFNVIEQPWIQVNSQTIQQIDSITDNTHLALPANSSATVGSGGTLTAGVIPSGQTYLMVWLGTGSSGTGVYLSTQRTTPYGISGYNSNVRRIGSILWTGGSIIPFAQYGNNGDRWCMIAQGAIALLTNQSSVAWTDVPPAGYAPPSAISLYLTILMNGPVNACDLAFRPRIPGATGNTGFLSAGAGGRTAAPIWCACDGAQYTQYEFAQAPGNTAGDIYISGYQESLL